MPLNYDFDINWTPPSKASQGGGTEDDAAAIYTARFRDPATVTALENADARVRQMFEASGFEFVKGRCDLPNGVYAAEDEVARGDAIARLSKNIPKYRLKETNFNGFELSEFLDYVSNAKGVSADEMEALIDAALDFASEDGDDEGAVDEPLKLATREMVVTAEEQALDRGAEKDELVQASEPADNAVTEAKEPLTPKTKRPPKLRSELVDSDTVQKISQERMVIPPRPEPTRPRLNVDFDALPRAIAKAGLAAGLSLMIGSAVFAGLGASPSAATVKHVVANNEVVPSGQPPISALSATVEAPGAAN